MPQPNRPEPGEWRLGVESGEALPPTPVRPQPEPDLSAQRLERPLFVVTVEHVAWLGVAVYALASRFVLLGMRPMNPGEARAALSALDISRRGLQAVAVHPGVGSGWSEALRGLIFFAFGTSEALARCPAALLGLALVGAGFALRPYLGRAGGLAFAALLALSPTVTWLSRSGYETVPAFALITVALALVFSAVSRPKALTVIAAAVAGAFALSAEPSALAIVPIFAAVLALMGLWEVATGKNRAVRFRVWWERRAGFVVFGLIVAVALFVILESDLMRQPFRSSLVGGMRELWRTGATPSPRAGFFFYFPVLAFYEFLIVILGALGTAALLGLRLSHRIGIVAFLWTTFAAAFFFGSPVHHQKWIVGLLVPAAMLGAAGIDCLHHTRAWRPIRYPLAALAALTFYQQMLVNFVYPAPVATEASWARHALLYWTAPTTTVEARRECEDVEQAVRRDGTVFFADEQPVLAWYLRALIRSDNPDATDVVIAPVDSQRPSLPSDHGESYEVTVQESWIPDLGALSPQAAIRYLFRARPWSEVKGNKVLFNVRKAVFKTEVPPTVIVAPTVSPTPTATATPAPAPTQPPASLPAAGATSGATLVPTVTATPVSTPAATLASPSAAIPEATSGATVSATPSSSASPSPAPLPDATAPETEGAGSEPTPSQPSSPQL